jgi:hypothetical protein
MNFTELEAKLALKIKETEPSLDITNADQKVLHVAIQDLQNYQKFITEPTTPTNPDTPETVKPTPQDPAEIDAFLTVWVGLWLKKWKERFNLAICVNNTKTAEKTEDTESQWLRLACREELTQIIISALIRNSEICGTTIIAENILKTELGKQKNQEINSKPQTIGLLNNALRAAREASQKTGPLVIIKVDKNYYCHVNA